MQSRTRVRMLSSIAIPVSFALYSMHLVSDVPRSQLPRSGRQEANVVQNASESMERGNW